MKAYKFNLLLQKIKYDKRAIEELYSEYYPKLIFHLKRKFGSLISPEDIGEEVFWAILSTEPDVHVKHPTTWLYRLADHKAIDQINLTKNEVPLSDELNFSIDLDAVIMKKDVKDILSQLDETSQKLIYLHIWEGYDYKELSEMFNVSSASIRTKVSRAYKIIKKYL